MARAIDAVQVLNNINWHHKPNPVSDFESGFNNGLNQAMWIITHAPTLTPPNEPRMINANKLAQRIAGHSNYHGDSILAAIYCTAEGKENNAPIRPIETPQNEPLTLDELQEMDGEPVWIEDVKHWALIDIEKGGQWDGMPFAVWAENGVKFTYNVESRDLHCYRRPPEGEV